MPKKPIHACLIGAASLAWMLPGQPARAQECTDAVCFVSAVERCEPAVFRADMGGDFGAQGRYSVLGEEDSACRIEFTFTENPNPAWVDTPFTFLVDPSAASQETLLGSVETCLSGGEDWYQCEGPLIEQISGSAQASGALAAGTGPFPCGRPVDAEGPALYPMPDDGAWGYVDRDGNWVIAPQYSQARDFHEGRAAVGGPSNWGIIDRDGNEVVPLRFESASGIDIDGRRWSASPFSPYSEGCTVMTHFTDTAQPAFFLDRDGKAYWRGDDRPEALKGRDIRHFGLFSEGLAWFQEGFAEEARFGWIDREGEIAIKPEFVQAGRFSDGLAFAAVSDGQGAYIAPDGRPVLPRKWTLYHGSPYSEGMARARFDAFEMAYWTTEDIAFDTVDFGTTKGDRPAEVPISSQAGDFHDGLAPVVTDRGSGSDFVYVGQDGKVAFVPDEIDGIAVCDHRNLSEFHNGLVRLVVADDGESCGSEAYTLGLPQYEAAHYVYLDTEGRVVLRQQK